MKGLCLFLAAGICGCLLTGCQPTAQTARQQDTWLLVSFEKDVPITYRMISERVTQIDLTTSDPSKRTKPQVMTERLELVMTYTPLEVDPFGLTTVEAYCNSAKVTRSSFSGAHANAPDAIETLKGKRFQMRISPTGELADTSDLQRVALEVGREAFDSSRSGQRIKNPDMISDFLAMQYFLWDSSSTIPDPLNLKPGVSWTTRQLLPWPVPFMNPPARMTTYALDSVSEGDDGGRRAHITSTYAMSDKRLDESFRPYEGVFQMRGLFGFLRNYEFKSIQGSGTQVFNMDKGLIESDQQSYRLDVTATFMLPLGDSLPLLSVDQKISLEHIDTP